MDERGYDLQIFQILGNLVYAFEAKPWPVAKVALPLWPTPVPVWSDVLTGEVPSFWRIPKQTADLKNSMDEGKVGAVVSVEDKVPTAYVIRPYLHIETEANTQQVVVRVSSGVPNGTTIVINVDEATMLTSDLRKLVVLLDGEEIAMAANLTDVLDPADKDVPKYAILITTGGIQVIVWIPSFSTHTITVAKIPTFQASNLIISPPEVMTGEPVSISVTVSNDGGIAGSYLLALNISGAVEATRSLKLEAGETENVTFELTKRAAETYGVEVAGLTGTFVVKQKPVNWPLMGGIVAVVALIGIAVGWKLKSKRRKPAETT
jgi:hypothetical protein